MGNKTIKDRTDDATAPPNTLRGKELKFYNLVMSMSSRKAEKEQEEYESAEKKIASSIARATSKETFMETLLGFRDELSMIHMDAAAGVSKKQISADLTREVFLIGGESFSNGDVSKIEEKIKRLLVDHDAHLRYICSDAIDGDVDLSEKEYQGWLRVKGRFGWHDRLVILTKNGDMTLHTTDKRDPSKVKLEKTCSVNEMSPLPSPSRKRNFTRSHTGLVVGLDDSLSPGRERRASSSSSAGGDSMTLWAQKPTNLDKLETALRNVSSRMLDLKESLLKSEIVQREADRLMLAMSRTNSGGDPYNKVLSLFPCTGAERYFVRARKRANRDTQVHVAMTHACVFTYNTFDVQFRDENGSPLEDERLEVSTVLMEVLTLGGKKSVSRRFLQIRMPDVETIGELIDVLGVPELSISGTSADRATKEKSSDS
eukprot:g686.t1